MRFVIIGGGPGGNTAATVAASLGAEVTLIERDIIGGAAHLWDCIPSKAMVATGGELTELSRANSMGLQAEGRLDVPALRRRISGMEETLREGVTSLLESQGANDDALEWYGRVAAIDPSHSKAAQALRHAYAERGGEPAAAAAAAAEDLRAAAWDQ